MKDPNEVDREIIIRLKFRGEQFPDADTAYEELVKRAKSRIAEELVGMLNPHKLRDDEVQEILDLFDRQEDNCFENIPKMSQLDEVPSYVKAARLRELLREGYYKADDSDNGKTFMYENFL